MRMNTKRILAALLSLVMLLALAPAGWAVNLTTPNTVEVNLVSQPDYVADIVNANITVDFYLIADAEPVTGYDMYSLKVKDAYIDLPVKSTDEQGDPTTSTLAAELEKQVNAEHPSYDEIVESLAKATLKEETPAPTPVTLAVSADKETITASGLAAGMYLMVPHGTVAPGTEITAKTGNTGYVKTITTGEGTAPLTLYRTRAYSKNYEYTFKPQLVTAPGKILDSGVPTYKPDEGTWTYEVPVNVKAERTLRNGSLQITKTLTNYADLSKEGSYFEPMTFTFSIVGEKDGKTVYQKVVALSVDSPVKEELVATLDDIPIGTEVTVTEVYSGAHATGQTTYDPFTINPPGIGDDGTITSQVVKFTNVNNNTHRGGHGIENKFEHDDEKGGWHWIANGEAQSGTSWNEVQGQ